MGQLIKLQDYVSRYEQDIYRYPAQFVRLKTQQWQKLKTGFESGEPAVSLAESVHLQPPAEEKGMLGRVKSIFKKNAKEEEAEEEHEEAPANEESELELMMPHAARSIDELKRNFLNQIFKFQLKWASSTLQEKSAVDQIFYFDEKLKFFLQRFPDTCLVLYKPVFQLQQAPVELDIILVSPVDIWCITILEGEEDAAFLPMKGRFWMKKAPKKEEKKVLNPLLSANRTAAVVNRLLTANHIDLPIKKVILTRNGYIDYPSPPGDVLFVDKRSFKNWFGRIRGIKTPLKHAQLRSAQVLLDHCRTSYYSRQDIEGVKFDGASGEDI
ncbi:NERD domain-containing protein [Peribacillus sp. SCS-37]|uniref:NERD domain-containing protein n=1 Tax=Paraperibacillus esterisolvens TaxID=3115296 RepID=UPI003905F378